MIKTEKPIQGNKYNVLNNVNIDSNIEMISDSMYNFIMNASKKCFITVEIDEQIYGNSYEMALVLLLLDYNNISASGVIKSYDNNIVKFGEIAGLDSKLKIDKNLLHNKIIDHVKLSPY